MYPSKEALSKSRYFQHNITSTLIKKNPDKIWKDNPIKFNGKVNKCADERFIDALNACKFVIHK